MKAIGCKRLWILLLILLLVPAGRFAATAGPKDLPVLLNQENHQENVVHGQVSGFDYDYDAARLDVYQESKNAVIEWRSFDIGKDAHTHFDQKGNSDWKVLNKIFDQDPSIINGRLSADGSVYLLNSNGIIFGESSKVDVHSLVASSLRITQEDFLNNMLRFRQEGDTAGAVVNRGEIRTDHSGSVFLLAPDVENSGLIVTPSGQIGLIAGEEAEIAMAEGGKSLFPDAAVLPPGDSEEEGKAENTGELRAGAGKMGMYGRIVRQMGRVESVTAIGNNGSIELLASEKVMTGPDSETTSPITDNQEKVHESFEIQGGSIEIGGLQWEESEDTLERFEHYGSITAPSGEVRVSVDANEQSTQFPARIYLAEGSSIDVSGEWISKSASDLTIEAQLNTVELKNDYGQKGEFLQGKTIKINPYEGSNIGDLSGYLKQEMQTAKEKATKGGGISLETHSGDIIVREGAALEFSGGGIRYSAGQIQKSVLKAGDMYYEIETAPEWLDYDKLVTRTENIPEHVQGHDAGTLELVGRAVVLNGSLKGSATRGMYQTELTIPREQYGHFSLQTLKGLKAPRGGMLIIGNQSPSTQRDFVVEEVRIQQNLEPLIASGEGANIALLGPGSPYISQYDRYREDLRMPLTLLSAKTLNKAGLSDLRIYSNTSVVIEEDVSLGLAPGGVLLDTGRDYLYGEEYYYLPDDYGEVPAASLDIRARRIVHKGEIRIPSAMVRLSAVDTVTNEKSTGFFNDNIPALSTYLASEESLGSAYDRTLELTERIASTGRSIIDVSGERINNSMAGIQHPERLGYTSGGRISLIGTTQDRADVILEQGSLMDVSAGCEMERGGSIIEGEAGEVTIQGVSVVPEGTLQGHSWIGMDGGGLTLHAFNIVVTEESPLLPEGFDPLNDPLPESFQETLYFDQDRLATTGFSDLTLLAYVSVTFEENGVLSPSRSKMYMDPADMNSPRITEVSDSLMTPGSVTVKTRQKLWGRQPTDSEDPYPVVIDGDAAVSVTPGGTISIYGRTIEGGDHSLSLLAPAGLVSLEAFAGDIHLGEGSRIDVSGAALKNPEPIYEGGPFGYTVMDGGEAELTARGSLILGEGPGHDIGSVLVDISGSKKVTDYMENLYGIYEPVPRAGHSGNLRLSASEDFDFADLTLVHEASLASAAGGGLSLETDQALVFDRTLLDFLERNAGLDSLSLSARSGIQFAVGAADLFYEQGLTLDAPEMTCLQPGADISFRSGWVRLINSTEKFSLSQPLEQKSDAEAIFDEFSAGVIRFVSLGMVDLEGSMALSNFGEVSLRAKEDIRLSDEQYTYKSGTGAQIQEKWTGRLETAGPLLSLEADRIYATTRSHYTLRAGNKIKTGYAEEPPSGAGPIVSAGGDVTVEAPLIEHTGYLAAPMGRITFRSSGQGSGGRLFFGRDSVVSVRGQSSVAYGFIYEDEFWKIRPHPSEEAVISTNENDWPFVESPPEQGISIESGQGEVIAMEGATFDVSGGGSIFAYSFMPSLEGLADPLKKDGRYVVVPGVDGPGEGVHLRGDGPLQGGGYALLPESHAFIPSAWVIEDVGKMSPSLPLKGIKSEEGYAMDRGYFMFMDTDLHETSPRCYTMQPASDVLEEGFYNRQELIAGDSGSISIQAPTTIIEGTLLAEALEGYSAGAIQMSGARSAIVTAADALPEDFGFESDLGESFENWLRFNAQGLSGQWERVTVGTSDFSVTEDVFVEEGANLQARRVSVFAKNAISLKSGSMIAGPEGERADVVELKTFDDTFVLSVDEGENAVSLGEGAEIHAQRVVLNADQLASLGSIHADEMSLRAQGIDIGPGPDHPESCLAPYSGEEPPGGEGSPREAFAVYPLGLYLQDDLAGFENLKSLRLIALDQITLYGGTSLTSIDDSLILDAGLIRGLAFDGRNGVTLQAGSISLMNSATRLGASEPLYPDRDSIEMVIRAGEGIAVGHGDVVMDGFESMALEAQGDVTFQGSGRLEVSGDEMSIYADRVTLSGYSLYSEDDLSLHQAILLGATVDNGFLLRIDSIPEALTGGEVRVNGRTVYDPDFVIDPEKDVITIGPWDELVKPPPVFEPAAFEVELVDQGALYIKPWGNGTQTGKVMPGGRLDMTAGEITLSGLVQGESALLGISAAQGDILLEQGGAILNPGGEYAGGGEVSLSAVLGDIFLHEGSSIDVSGGSRGDAGRIMVSAEEGVFSLDGILQGQPGSQDGPGGSFFLDAGSFTDFSQILSSLTAGGFHGEISVRKRTGSLVVDSDIRAHRVTLAADGQDVDVQAAIDASGEKGGRIELYAVEDMVLRAGSLLDVHATGENGDGGSVFVSSASQEGMVRFHAGAEINASAAGDGQGGTIHFRARRTQDNRDMNMDLDGTRTGAEEVIAEGFKVYDTGIGTFNLNSALSEAEDFYNQAVGSLPSGILLRPGIEVRETGDMTISREWDFTERRFGASNQPGILTLRSAGDLAIEEGMVDQPSKLVQNGLPPYTSSWSFHLVSGADLGGADPLAVNNGAGTFEIHGGAHIYTRTGSIYLASGGDALISEGAAYDLDYFNANCFDFLVNDEYQYRDKKMPMFYHVGTYEGEIHGSIGGNLHIGGAVQSATGDIRMDVGGDVEFGEYGAIRTTGFVPMWIEDWSVLHQEFSLSRDGGNVSVQAGGSIRQSIVVEEDVLHWFDEPDAESFDLYKVESFGFSAIYRNEEVNGEEEPAPTVGMVTMGGGDVSISAGGGFHGLAGTFQQGDLDLISRGNLSGVLLVNRGQGSITSLGNVVRNEDHGGDLSLAVLESQFEVSAVGEIAFATAFNPTYANAAWDSESVLSYFNDGDTGDDVPSVFLQSLSGDVLLSGDYFDIDSNDAERKRKYRVLPPIMNVGAGEDIFLTDRFILAPSEAGGLSLIAAGDIDGFYQNIQGSPTRSRILVSDVDPVSVYEEGRHISPTMGFRKIEAHQQGTPLHMGDTNPVSIQAKGTIREFELIAPKMAEVVSSGGDIKGLFYYGQNVHSSDVSLIRAQGNILLDSVTLPEMKTNTGLVQNGPGDFLVQAGGRIDLGQTRGVEMNGDLTNPALRDYNDAGDPAALFVVSGYDQEISVDSLLEYYDVLFAGGLMINRVQQGSDGSGSAGGAFQDFSPGVREALDTYFPGWGTGSHGTGGGGADSVKEIQEIIHQAGNTIFPGGLSEAGDLTLTASQISSAGRAGRTGYEEENMPLAKSADLYLLVGGKMNVGRTTILDPSEYPPGSRERNELADRKYGIFTSEGGDISIFSRSDIDVFESRVMTFRGGDIFAWSDEGDINAGRGSKTAISTEPPRVVVEEDGDVSLVFSPPAVGSGIRTLTYDPDGFLGATESPPIGDAYLYAPQGVLDAGEAGIAARNIFAFAQEVHNVQNIELSGGTSLGLSLNAQAETNIGSMTGTGSLSSLNKMAEQASGLDKAKERAEKAAERMRDLTPSWLDVRVEAYLEES